MVVVWVVKELLLFLSWLFFCATAPCKSSMLIRPLKAILSGPLFVIVIIIMKLLVIVAFIVFQMWFPSHWFPPMMSQNPHDSKSNGAATLLMLILLERFSFISHSCLPQILELFKYQGLHLHILGTHWRSTLETFKDWDPPTIPITLYDLIKVGNIGTYHSSYEAKSISSFAAIRRIL